MRQNIGQIDWSKANSHSNVHGECVKSVKI